MRASDNHRMFLKIISLMISALFAILNIKNIFSIIILILILLSIMIYIFWGLGLVFNYFEQTIDRPIKTQIITIINK